jgi:hypothetical protein
MRAETAKRKALEHFWDSEKPGHLGRDLALAGAGAAVGAASVAADLRFHHPRRRLGRWPAGLATGPLVLLGLLAIGRYFWRARSIPIVLPSAS